MILSYDNTSLNAVIPAPPSKSIYHRELIIRFMLGDREHLSPVPGDNDDVLATKAVLSAINDVLSSESGVSDSDDTKHSIGEVILPCNESGSTLRFMIPVAAALILGAGHSLPMKLIFSTKGRLFDRPLDELRSAMRSHGITIEKDAETRSIIVTGVMTPGEYTIDGSVSSQYISGLIMALTLFKEKSIITVTGEIKSLPYIELTQQVLEKYGCPALKQGNSYYPHPIAKEQNISNTLIPFNVEGDWSNGAFLLCLSKFSDITVTNLNPDSKQGDRAILKYLDMVHEYKHDKFITMDCSDIPDITPYMAICAPYFFDKAVFTGISRLRIKESDRVTAVREQLAAVGVDTDETEDTLTVYGTNDVSTKKEQPIRLSSYHDHRMAMCAVLLMVILKTDIEIDDMDCVKKSYPELLDLPFIKLSR